jgi:hypothetical protein
MCRSIMLLYTTMVVNLRAVRRPRCSRPDVTVSSSSRLSSQCHPHCSPRYSSHIHRVSRFTQSWDPTEKLCGSTPGQTQGCAAAYLAVQVCSMHCNSSAGMQVSSSHGSAECYFQNQEHGRLIEKARGRLQAAKLPGMPSVIQALGAHLDHRNFGFKGSLRTSG